MISSSDPIPEGDTDQPPHSQAANYYKSKLAKVINGKFLVTMAHPPGASKPKKIEIEIGVGGAKHLLTSSLGGAALHRPLWLSRRLIMAYDLDKIFGPIIAPASATLPKARAVVWFSQWALMHTMCIRSNAAESLMERKPSFSTWTIEVAQRTVSSDQGQ